ncbi:MAG: Gldg family protein, partial [Clostridia bacterium]|nr:Gldg family protein [Clostridia bacterium]
KTHRFRRGGMALAMTALFLVFVVLINLIAVVLTDRYIALSPDLTSNKIYSLSDTTLQLLDSLECNVEIDIIAPEADCKYTTVDFDPYGHVPMATELIERYAKQSDRVRVEFIDLSTDPGFLDKIEEYRDAVYDYCIIVRSDKRMRMTSFYEMLPSLTSTASTDDVSIDTASSLTEMYISSLIKTVSLDVVPTVAYLDTLGGSEMIDNLLDGLYYNGYSILTSNDFAFGYEPIPDEVDMVIIGAPTYDLTTNQLVQLSDFLENGGRLGKSVLIFTSPMMGDCPNLATLIEEWGMTYTRDTVYEGSSVNVLPTMSADMFNATYMQSEYVDDDIVAKNTPVYGALNIEIPRQTSGSIAVNAILSSSSQGYVCPSGEVFDEANYTSADGAYRYIMAQATNYRESDSGESLRSDVILAPISLCYGDWMGSSVYSNYALMMGVCNQRCGIVDENLDISASSLTAEDFSLDTSIIVVLTVIFGYLVPLSIAIFGLVVYLRRRRL